MVAETLIGNWSLKEDRFLIQWKLVSRKQGLLICVEQNNKPNKN